MKIRTKLEIIFIMISLLPLCIVGLFYDLNAQATVEQKVSQFSKQLVSSKGDYLNSRISGLERSINTTVGNELLQDILSTYKSKHPFEQIKDLVNIRHIMYSVFHLNSEVRSIILYLYNGDIELYGEEYWQSEAFKEREYYPHLFKSYFEDIIDNQVKIQRLKNKATWMLSFKDDHERIYLMREISNLYRGEPLGIVIYAIDVDMFKKVVYDTRTEEGEEIFMIDEANRYIADSNGAKYGASCKAAYIDDIRTDRPYGIVRDNGQIISYRNISNGWKLISSTSTASLMKDIVQVRRIAFIIAIICIVAVLTISITFSIGISKQFALLICKMERVERGDMNIIEPIRNSDEISIVYRHFYKMADRLKALIQKNYVQELEKREAELNALQYQINPHFLYNTLETINAIAQVYGCGEIRTISQKLGDMFRYNMKKNGEGYTALTHEIDHIKNYIYLQQIQYDKPFEVFYDIDPPVMNCKILRFILQPIVENTIIHGFKARGGSGCLEIIGKTEKDHLILLIQDDGVGMNEEKVNHLNEYIRAGDQPIGYHKSIGLRNVNLRIKLAFGDQYGMQVDSCPGRGTVVQLLLPIIRWDGRENV